VWSRYSGNLKSGAPLSSTEAKSAVLRYISTSSTTSSIPEYRDSTGETPVPRGSRDAHATGKLHRYY
jgi:hypothetical protein